MRGSGKARRLTVLGVVPSLSAAACGNSGSSKPADTAPPSTAKGSTGITEVTGAALRQNDPVSATGVTSTQIGVAVITSTTNIRGGLYGAYGDGIQAYFDYVNAPASEGGEGGLYGRQLKITASRDDKFFNNQQTVKASLAEDHAFATFVATPQFSGARDLADAKQPTFIWNINPEMFGHTNIFGTVGALCFACIGQGLPFIAQQQHFTKVAVLAYGVTASSKQCGQAIGDSFKKYPSADVVFSDYNLQFAQADLSADVSEMKKKGAQFIMTCIDQKEALVLAKEIAKQHLDAVQNLPNAYDPQFVADNAQLLEGSLNEPQFVPLEETPLLPEQQLFEKWMQKDGKQIHELAIEGWIAANEFVHGLKLAGPNFSQQKLISSLNQETHFTANGMIEPIDWTKQHFDPKGHLNLAGKYECSTLVIVKNGKFVPGPHPAGKPWTCMVGGPQGTAPTLTKTPVYESFAPTSP
jgi:branched-chain amino acid transport system substrate-binding protein